MKKILIIMGNHSPNPSSVAICVEPLINKMANSEFEIDIVTDRKYIKVPKHELINNINVYRVDDYRRMNTIVLNELCEIRSAKMLRVITKLITLILKGCYYIRYCIVTKENQTAGWPEKEVVAKCVELYKNRKYDAIISISQPFKSHYIAKQLIDKISEPIKWFIYEFDPFSYNTEITKNTWKRKKLFKDEYNLFQACDKIFLTPELHRFYKGTQFNIFSHKFIPIPYANIQPIRYEKEAIKIKLSPTKINCIFIGSLYKDIRNPSYLLKLFLMLNRNIHLSLITNYSKEQLRRDIKDIIDNENIISVYPLQTRNIALNVIMQSDILVNIGNTVKFQIPGKIFEYMSTGKPIIHFSKFEDDPALIYLERYPRILIIKEWEGNIEEQAIQVEKFCKNNKGSNLSFAEVCTALSGIDGNSVSEKFVDIITTLLERKRNYE